MFLIKINSSGNKEWARDIGVDYGLQGLTAVPNDDKSFTIVGNKLGYGNSNVIQNITAVRLTAKIQLFPL